MTMFPFRILFRNPCKLSAVGVMPLIWAVLPPAALVMVLTDKLLTIVSP
jgi:hypothetical protein